MDGFPVRPDADDVVGSFADSLSDPGAQVLWPALHFGYPPNAVDSHLPATEVKSNTDLVTSLTSFEIGALLP